MINCGTSLRPRFIFIGTRRLWGHAEAASVTTVSCQHHKNMWVTHMHIWINLVMIGIWTCSINDETYILQVNHLSCMPDFLSLIQLGELTVWELEAIAIPIRFTAFVRNGCYWHWPQCCMSTCFVPQIIKGGWFFMVLFTCYGQDQQSLRRRHGIGDVRRVQLQKQPHEGMGVSITVSNLPLFVFL